MNPQFITDHTGKKLAVILSMEEYEKIMELLEDMDDVRLYDEAKAENEIFYSLEEAFSIIEKERKKKDEL